MSNFRKVLLETSILRQGWNLRCCKSHHQRVLAGVGSKPLNNHVSKHHQSSLGTAAVSEAKDGALGPKKKVKRPPFAKELFLGRFDKDALHFPEVLEKDELKELEEMVKTVEKFFIDKVDSKKIDHEAKIPEAVMNGLKELGLFGQQIPLEYGGLGFGATEFARMAESCSMDGGIAVTLSAHQSIGLKGILILGTEEQKKKYLPKLATGEHIAAFCLTEPGSGSDAASVQTLAVLNEKKTHYILNGSKIWISNGGIADIFTVFAKTIGRDYQGKEVEEVTAFIVEKKFGGITNGREEDKLGIRGSNTCAVHFENTLVPIENVLGEVGEGFKVAVNILNSGRFTMGSSSAGALKRLLGVTIEHAVNRVQFKKPLMEFELIQEKVAKIACNIYAMESMSYLTAGWLDLVESPDCAVEAAMVKVFSSESLWLGVSECLQILGGLGYMKDYPFERLLRDSRITMIFEGTNEILRLLISLMGCSHAGKILKEDVKKLRNPLLNPGFIIRRIIQRERVKRDKPAMDMDLSGYVHPSLVMPARNLEHAVCRLQYAVEVVMARYGKEVINKQMELRRLADIAINIYAMTACLARASRSYCIGLRNADLELLMATTFSKDCFDKIQNLVAELEDGPIKTNDNNYKTIAGRLFKYGGYAAEHPLEQNW